MVGGGAFEGALTVDQVRNRLIEAARANPGRSAKFINDVKRAFDNGLKEPARPRGRASKPPPELTITLSMAEVEMKPIEWLWPDRVAIGKLTMLAGHPANGKSLVTLDMAARISTGSSWPLNGSRAPLGNVILLSAEDDPADTYGPRLKAMDADLSAAGHPARAVKHQFHCYRPLHHATAVRFRTSRAEDGPQSRFK